MSVIAPPPAAPPGPGPSLPPERRGMARDGVRLLAAGPAGITHHRFHRLPQLLCPGDLLVVNVSATIPAALDAVRDGLAHPLHVAGEHDDGTWVVEPRAPGNTGPARDGRAGQRVHLPGGLVLTLTRPYPDAGDAAARLWLARPAAAVDRLAYLTRWGRPIRYPHAAPVPLGDLQNVYAAVPGSAEMPSAGRPITPDVVRRLVAAEVGLLPVLLHAGVSSQERHEPPAPERFAVPQVTADAVNAAHHRGAAVIGVGTTAVRALEAAAGPGGVLRAARGWTDLYLTHERPAMAVTGVLSGLHPPEATHLHLLEAVVGADLVDEAYLQAGARGYLHHEFGDSMLLRRMP